MKSFLKWVLILSTVLFIFIFGLILIITLMLDTTPKISSNSYLYLPLSGVIQDYTPPDPFENFIRRQSLDLKIIRDAIEKAAVDDRINGVILKIGLLQIGYGKLQELHEVINKYRLSGKKIYAYIETGLTKEYYLALACDSICMPPNGSLFLTGLNSEVTFYKDFFNKIGVEAEFIHVGKYKSAPEIFTNNQMSVPHREELQNLINKFYLNLTTTIAENRNLSIQSIDSLIDNKTVFSGNEALKYQLVDQVSYINELTEHLNIDDSRPQKVHVSTYSSVPASSLKIRNKSSIAVIHVSGTILTGSDSNDPVLGNLAGANSVVRNLKFASSSRMIKAIVLRIDSPGGSAIASDIILDAVKKASEKKPVIASIADYGASGGYMIALGADSIVAESNSLIGSIGIFAGKFNIQRLYQKLGVNTTSLSRGKNAGIFSVYKSWTMDEKKIITKHITNYYSYFVKTVAHERQLSEEIVKSIAEGRVWTGGEAFENGLIDQIGTIYDAIRISKEKVGIDKENSVRLIYFPKERSIFSEIFNYISIYSGIRSSFLENEYTRLTIIQNQPLALMPFKMSWN